MNCPKEDEKSETHYLIIDCKPGKIRPFDVLKVIITEEVETMLEEDSLINKGLKEEDFIVVYINFGECKFAIKKDKEKLFELNIPKLSDQLKGLYKRGIIRYAEWSPE